MVFSGLVTALPLGSLSDEAFRRRCRPTIGGGWWRAPSEFSMTRGWLPSMMATQGVGGAERGRYQSLWPCRSGPFLSSERAVSGPLRPNAAFVIKFDLREARPTRFGRYYIRRGVGGLHSGAEAPEKRGGKSLWAEALVGIVVAVSVTGHGPACWTPRTQAAMGRGLSAASWRRHRFFTPGNAAVGRKMSVAHDGGGALWLGVRTGKGYSLRRRGTPRARVGPRSRSSVAGPVWAGRSARCGARIRRWLPFVNWYGEGAKMGLHQDRDEADFDMPVVSISLGGRGALSRGRDRAGAGRHGRSGSAPATWR